MDKNTVFPGFARALLAVVLTAGVASVSACKADGEGNAQAKAPEAEKVADAIPVEVARASRRAVAASYTGTGALDARAESQVVAKTSGIAMEVFAEEGDHVRAGQVLVRLDADRARLQAAQSAAQVRKLEANYTRAKQLAAQQMVSANDLDQLKYDLANARAVNNLANLELSYTKVVAPISGVVASRSIKPGNFVQINTPIFRIVDDSRLELTLNVPEREISTLKTGQPVKLQVDALPGRTFDGTVDRVAPVVDAGSGTFRVICSFAGGDALQAGMFGRIRIDYDKRADALVVPRVALLDDQGTPAVYAVRDGKAVRVPVKTGYTDGDWTEIVEGLKVGDAVVTAGKVALREGSAVQVIGEPAGKAKAGTVASSDTGTEGKQ